jgi:hypothetical protein
MRKLYYQWRARREMKKSIALMEKMPSSLFSAIGLDKIEVLNGLYRSLHRMNH